MKLRTLLCAPALALTAALALTSCTASTPPAPASASSPSASDTTASFPRTISVPAGSAAGASEVTVPAEPQRIVALSYETVAVAVELGLADRLVMIPEEAKNPALTDHAADLAAVSSTIPTASTFDPELVIAQQPDLVLLTARHGVEDGAGAALTAAGIPTLVLPNSWSSLDEITADVALVGEASGTDEAAARLTASLEDGLAESATDDADQPRVLILSNQAGRAFVTAGTAFPTRMLTLAGGADASADLGVKATGPITAEQIVQADPDGILLIDMNGSGKKIFDAVLTNPAVAALPAVADERTHLVTGKQVQALGLTSAVDGLTDLREWVGTL